MQPIPGDIPTQADVTAGEARRGDGYVQNECPSPCIGTPNFLCSNPTSGQRELTKQRQRVYNAQRSGKCGMTFPLCAVRRSSPWCWKCCAGCPAPAILSFPTHHFSPSAFACAQQTATAMATIRGCIFSQTRRSTLQMQQTLAILYVKTDTDNLKQYVDQALSCIQHNPPFSLKGFTSKSQNESVAPTKNEH